VLRPQNLRRGHVLISSQGTTGGRNGSRARLPARWLMLMAAPV
jgi:hypothetical protein